MKNEARMSSTDSFQPSSFDYAEPVKRIHDSQGLQSFQTSIALYELQRSLSKIVELVEGKEVPQGVLNKSLLYSDQEVEKYSHDVNLPIAVFEDTQNSNLLEERMKTKPYINSLLQLFEELSLLVDQVPPLEGPRRYGNLACREWHTKLEGKVEDLLRTYVIPYYELKNPDGFIKEVGWYLLNAFGSKERLDYGTGHELNFLAFITGLWKTDVIKQGEVDGYDFLILFGRYFDLSRKLITTYSLEPAGSHGVWGLDDHFHISYILGASEFLKSSKTIPGVSPKMINNRSIVYQYSVRNLYFNSIAFIYKVKKGAFFEHSPILYDVSNVKNWEKILKGMLKMYSAEVVNKFPVVQHFYFGNVLFPWRSVKNNSPLPIHVSEESLAESSTNQSHKSDEWKSRISQEHNFTQIPTVTAPWKNKAPQSFQDKLTSSQPSSRRSPILSNPQNTTRAPWAQGSGGSGSINQETTKVPWATR